MCACMRTCVGPCVRACVRACVARARVPPCIHTCTIYIKSLVLRRRPYWTEQSRRMIFITIPATLDDGETRGEDNCRNYMQVQTREDNCRNLMQVCLYMIQASMDSQ